jgi:hypothetical protein
LAAPRQLQLLEGVARAPSNGTAGAQLHLPKRRAACSCAALSLRARARYTMAVFPGRLRFRVRPWHAAALLLCAAHALTLTRLPFMHADEAWLASSTRAILRERTPAARDDFVQLNPRPPHAFRLVFHALQAPFVAASWSLAGVRLLSLASGVAGIALAAAVARRTLSTPAARWLFVCGLAVDPQFFVSSHLARQEIVLVAAFLAAVAARGSGAGRPRNALAVASILGLAIGVHANSFVIALPIAALYLRDVAVAPRGDRMRAALRVAAFAAALAAWALAWIGASRLLDPGFPRAYLEFGARYGVGDSLAAKLLGLPGFYQRLFDRVAGTYYVPDVRLPLLVFAVAAVAAAGVLVARAFEGARSGTARAAAQGRLVGDALAMVIAVNAGFVAIGKYSQPSAVLLFPSGYLLAAALLDAWLSVRAAPAVRLGAASAVAALIAALAAGTAALAAPWLPVSYSAYVARIRDHVPRDARVLAGLNTAFAFDGRGFHAFADLAELERSGLTFAGYVERFGIGYILYPDELDRIYAERPVWNDLYGNLAPYYDQMRTFVRERCSVVATLEEPVFAMRIVAYAKTRPWRLTILRVRPG